MMPAKSNDNVRVNVGKASPNSAERAIDKIGIASGFPTHCLAIAVASIWTIAAAAYVWVGNSYQA